MGQREAETETTIKREKKIARRMAIISHQQHQQSQWHSPKGMSSIKKKKKSRSNIANAIVIVRKQKAFIKECGCGW